MLAPTVSFAQAGPTSFNISGTLYDASGNMISQTGVNFQVEILAITTSPAQTCVLYSELHSNQDLSHTKGGFTLEVGAGTSRQNFLETSSVLSSKIFENSGTLSFPGCSITVQSGDQRYVRISYDIGGGLIAMTPNVPIDAASYSTVAETLQGKRPEDFLQVHNDGSSVFLDQTNLEFPYSATNWPKFQALLNGTSSQYIPSAPGSTVDLNGQVLTNIAAPVAGTDATNKNYVDGSIGGKTADLTGVGPATGDGDTLIWDQGANKWKVGPVSDDTKLPLLGGTMAGPITMGGFDLYNTGHITMGTQRLLNLGTFTTAQEGALTLGTADKGKILYNTDLSEIRVWNGSAFSGTSPVTSVNGKTGAVSLNVMDIYMAGTAALWDVGTAHDNVVQLDSNAHLPAVDGSALTNINGASIDGSTLTNVNAVRLQGYAVSATPPTGGYVLQYNSTSTKWEPTAIPSAPVSTVAGRTGDVTLDVSDIQSATGKYFSYQPNGTACADGEILKWNSTRWECAADSTNTGDITDVNAGNGLLGGGTSGSVTLSVNIGTGSNQIVQLDSLGRLPALDGSALTNINGSSIDGSTLTNVNAVRLQSQPVAATTPSGGQVLKWNDLTSQWEPGSDNAGIGTITEVAAGTGVTGGGNTGSVTVGVDAGTGPNQIVQLDSASRLPAVDGSALTNISGASIDGSTLTNVNAVRLQGYAVSATPPTGGYVLQYNSTSTQWESVAIPSAPVSTVAGRTGDVTLDVSDIQSATGKYFSYQPNGTACADGEILKWNSTRWECAADSTNTGDITDVNAGNGLLGGGTSGSVTLSVNVGTSANQIVQLDSLGHLPALDGSALTNINGSSIDGSTLTNVNAIRLQTYPISSATPNPGQVLTWNGTISQWEPQTSVATSTINSVSAGTGATGGGTTGDVTIGVDVGTGPNQIVQLDSSSHLPAVDGSALTNINGASIDGSTLTNVNAVRIQGYAVSATAPTGGYVLQYNSTSTQWESVAIPSAPVSTVAGRTGDVTLDVSDIQSATGKYFSYQPNGTACADGEILKWNSTRWECAADSTNTGDITDVNAGNGLLGGGTSGSVTLSVNVGTSANQIVQLDSLGHLPALDGSALTNINGSSIDGSTLTNLNAIRLQSRAISSTQPNDNEVLTWNNATSTWEPRATSTTGITELTGDVLAAGTGSVAATISENAITSAKINNTGNTQNRLLITDSTSGTLVTYKTCALNEILKWNATGWECAADSTGSGDITDVNAGNGLLGGGTSGSVTLSVNVGTSANQIVQLDSLGHLPALDGSALTNINGSSIDGSTLTNLNAVRLQTYAISNATPNPGQVLTWNGTTSQWEPQTSVASSTINSITAGTGATGGGTTGDVTIGVDVGTGSNQIVQLDNNGHLPAVDGSALTNINGAAIDGSTLTNVNAIRIQGYAVSATAPTGGYVLQYNSTSTQWESVAIPSAPVSTVAGRTGDVTLDVSDIQSATGKYFSYQPNGTACADGEILKWNSTRWECSTDSSGTGDITDVNAGNGLLGGGTSGSVTLSVNAGTSANQIVQLDSLGRLPALDGSALTNINGSSIDGSTLTNLNAIRLQTYAISNATPNPGQVLTWNGTTSQWEPQTSVASSTINSITAGTGATGGGTTGDVTIGVDVGTGSNQIVQLDNNGHLPAVDGSALTNINGASIDGSTLTNVNAVRIQGYAVSATAPTGGYVLQYNSTSTQWESVAIPSAPVSTVAGRTGDVTLDVSDIQSASGKYFTYQPNGAACSTGEILKWNSSHWECAADSSGTGDITDVNAGNGLLGGGTSGSVTLSVNVGTAANKIVQLDSNAFLPALDGNLLTNLNAVRLQSRSISSATPNPGQVLTWNGTTSQWEPQTSVATSTINSITAGTGATGGGTTGDVTIGVNAGTGPNQIVQLDSSSRLPAVDGSALTNIVNSVAGRTGAVVLNVSDIQSASGKYFTYQPNGAACSTGEILKWNSTRWECAADSSGTGDITDVNAGNGLLGGGTSGSVTLSVNVGTSANQIVQLDGSGHLPAVDGGSLTNVNAVRLQSRAISSTPPNDNEVLTWNNTTSKWEPRATSTTGITGLTGDVLASGTGSVAATISDNAITSAKINNVGNTQNRLLITDATSGATVTYKTCALNQILKWNSTGWECATDSTGTGDITDVNAGNGLLGGGTSGSVTLSVNVGTSANQIVQLDGSAFLPAVDGNKLTNLNAVRLQNFAVASTTPTSGKVLTWNGTTSQWEPQATAVTGVSYIGTGTGLTGGPISSTGTLAVDTGTTANKIVQLDGNAFLPAVDGNKLTNVNASRIGTRAIASTAPIANQVLLWNSTTSQWEPQAVPASADSWVNGGNSFGANSTIGNNDNFDLGFETNGTTKMTVKTDGKVGIGTTAPGYTLDVSGTARMTSTVAVGTTTGRVQLAPGSATQAGYISWYQPDGATRLGYIGWDPANIRMSLENSANFIISGGSVGIGTTAPANALDVSGAINSTSGFKVGNTAVVDSSGYVIPAQATAGAGCSTVGSVARDASGNLLVCQ